MIPVLAAVAKNISIAAESEKTMTDEEIELALQEVTARLEQFGPEEKVNNKEWRQYVQVRKEKDILNNIKKARATGNYRQESKNLMEYHLLKNSKDMNCILRYLLQVKLRSQIWI
jgi:hypothetical protein